MMVPRSSLQRHRTWNGTTWPEACSRDTISFGIRFVVTLEAENPLGLGGKKPKQPKSLQSNSYVKASCEDLECFFPSPNRNFE